MMAKEVLRSLDNQRGPHILKAMTRVRLWMLCCLAVVSARASLGGTPTTSTGAAAVTNVTAHERTISPDGAAVAWVEPYYVEHPEYMNEVDQYRTQNARLYIARDGQSPVAVKRPRESNGVDFDKLFIPSSVTHCWFPAKLQWDTQGNLYFTAPAWVTSAALWRVSAGTYEAVFVTGANGYEVIPSGKYKDHLIVGKHKYWLGAGSYDWWWLVTPEGEEVDPIGPIGSHCLTAFKDMWINKPGNYSLGEGPAVPRVPAE